MDLAQNVRFFLGANTAKGFYSAYESFADERNGDFVWYIKGGPGNGKSTFMKRVAEAAEQRGERVEYAFCSGDPDSLDGIYLPERKTAYVDATAPHVQEPMLPGAAGRYIDLSAYYRPRTGWDREQIAALFEAYREQYRRACGYFDAALACDPLRRSDAIHPTAAEAAMRAAETLPQGEKARVRERFTSAYTCRGLLAFPELAAQSGKTCAVMGTGSDRQAFFRTLLALCVEKKLSVIRCPDPLDPADTDAVLIPEAGVCYVTRRRGVKSGGKAVSVSPEGVRDGGDLPPEELRRRARLCSSLLSLGCESLERAKAEHDLLEKQYADHVVFRGMDALIRKHIR